MKKLIIAIFITLLFTCCVKITSNQQNQIVNTDLDNNSFIIEEDESRVINIELDNQLNEEKTEYTNILNYYIVTIWEYIFNDLNIKYRFKSIDELLQTLNLPENYNVIEYEKEIRGLVYFYDIEWNGIKLSYMTSDYIDYYLYENIEIELSENNYLNLFPYMNIEEFMNDKDFGEAYVDKNTLYYFIYLREDHYGVYDYCCRLIFNDGLLKSIIIDPYRT